MKIILLAKSCAFVDDFDCFVEPAVKQQLLY
jgi:hypothetical protein